MTNEENWSEVLAHLEESKQQLKKSAALLAKYEQQLSKAMTLIIEHEAHCHQLTTQVNLLVEALLEILCFTTHTQVDPAILIKHIELKIHECSKKL